MKNVVRCPGQFKKYAVSIEFKEGRQNNDMLFCSDSGGSFVVYLTRQINVKCVNSVNV